MDSNMKKSTIFFDYCKGLGIAIIILLHLVWLIITLPLFLVDEEKYKKITDWLNIV